MKTGLFKIALSDGTFDEVVGPVSEHFGIHKTDFGSWRVTHLRTGLLAPTMGLRFKKEIIAYVKQLELSPVPWDKDPKEFCIPEYSLIVHEILDAAQKTSK